MTDDLKDAPVRLCCGETHSGPVCPDGRVMCCLCFNRFEVRDLNRRNGQIEDVCQWCAAAESGAQRNPL